MTRPIVLLPRDIEDGELTFVPVSLRGDCAVTVIAGSSGRRVALRFMARDLAAQLRAVADELDPESAAAGSPAVAVSESTVQIREYRADPSVTPADIARQLAWSARRLAAH